MNKVALITGASRGIGRGIAFELAQLGWDLLLNFRSNAAAAEETAALCRARHNGIRVETCQADISRASDRDALLSLARSQFSALDLLVNNAGVAPKERVDMLQLAETSFNELLEINLNGPFFLSQAVAGWMLERATAEKCRTQAKIVFISSVSAYTPSVERAEYCISKAGLAMVTQLFAARLAASGINVYEIRPGVIETDMTAGVKGKYDGLISDGLTPIARWGQPADVGKAVAAIAQGSFPFSTGEVLNVDGGFHMHWL